MKRSSQVEKTIQDGVYDVCRDAIFCTGQWVPFERATPELRQLSKEVCSAKPPQIQPLHDRVVVILDEFKERSVIITPDIAKEKPRMGVVEAAGPGRWIDDSFYHTQVKPGQRVLLSPGVNVDYDDIVRREGRVVVQEADIMGVLS